MIGDKNIPDRVMSREDKEDILNNLIDQGKVIPVIDVEKADGMVFIYYMSKLHEGGFIDNGINLTVKGFDMCMDLIEAGWLLSKQEIYVDTIALIIPKSEDVNGENEGLSLLVENMQEHGIEGMTKLLEEEVNPPKKKRWWKFW